MKRNLKLQEETDEVKTEEESAYAFLHTLRETMENTMLSDAADVRKVGLVDYLKLIALLEEKRKASRPESEEVVVRWEDPITETDGELSCI